MYVYNKGISALSLSLSLYPSQLKSQLKSKTSTAARSLTLRASSMARRKKLFLRKIFVVLNWLSSFVVAGSIARPFLGLDGIPILLINGRQAGMGVGSFFFFFLRLCRGGKRGCV